MLFFAFTVSGTLIPGGREGGRSVAHSSKAYLMKMLQTKISSTEIREKHCALELGHNTQQIGCSLFCPLPFCQVFRLSRNTYFELLVPFSYCDTGLASTGFFIMSLTGSESCANLDFYFKKQIEKKFVYVK